MASLNSSYDKFLSQELPEPQSAWTAGTQFLPESHRPKRPDRHRSSARQHPLQLVSTSVFRVAEMTDELAAKAPVSRLKNGGMVHETFLLLIKSHNSNNIFKKSFFLLRLLIRFLSYYRPYF